MFNWETEPDIAASKVVRDAEHGHYSVRRHYPSLRVERPVTKITDDEIETVLIRLGWTREYYDNFVIALANTSKSDAIRYQDDLRLYNEELSEKRALLKSDLEKETGLVGSPQADMLWKKITLFLGSRGEVEIARHYTYFAPLLGGSDEA